MAGTLSESCKWLGSKEMLDKGALMLELGGSKMDSIFVSIMFPISVEHFFRFSSMTSARLSRPLAVFYWERANPSHGRCPRRGLSCLCRRLSGKIWGRSVEERPAKRSRWPPEVDGFIFSSHRVNGEIVSFSALCITPPLVG